MRRFRGIMPSSPPEGIRPFKPLLGESTMAAVSQMIRTAIVELRSKAGSFYARPSPWERLYLIWTLRNFHALPKEVLNSRNSRLANKLGHSVDFSIRLPI